MDVLVVRFTFSVPLVGDVEATRAAVALVGLWEVVRAAELVLVAGTAVALVIDGDLRGDFFN